VVLVRLTSSLTRQTWASYLEPGLETIADATAKLFLNTTAAPFLTNGTVWSADQARVLVNPVGSIFKDLAPFPFGGRVFVNTVAQVFPVLIPFFGTRKSVLDLVYRLTL
jgi:hypothetical protein